MKLVKNKLREAVWLHTEGTLRDKNMAPTLLAHYAKSEAEMDEMSHLFWLVEQLKQVLVPYKMGEREKSAVYTSLTNAPAQQGRFSRLKQSLLLPITLITSAISIVGIGIMLIRRIRARRMILPQTESQLQM